MYSVIRTGTLLYTRLCSSQKVGNPKDPHRGQKYGLGEVYGGPSGPAVAALACETSPPERANTAGLPAPESVRKLIDTLLELRADYQNLDGELKSTIDRSDDCWKNRRTETARARSSES